jgi:hypothetical protein
LTKDAPIEAPQETELLIKEDSTGPLQESPANGMKMTASTSRPCRRKLHLWAALRGTIDGHFEENGC